MHEEHSWQDATIRDLIALLAPDEGVLALAVAGSCARAPSTRDDWSDIDLLIVVDERSLGRFFPGTDWLRPLGELYACEQHPGAMAHTTRVCFADFRRVDVVLTTETALEQIDSWGFVSFRAGTRTLFSRSAVADEVLSRKFPRPVPPLISPEQFGEMADHFRFRAALAVTKVVRGDLLLALHLALGLARDCCELGMLLRDRSAGTSHHRRGGAGNDLIERLLPSRGTSDADDILDGIEKSVVAFDSLAARWSGDYAERRGPLLAAIERARGDLRGASGRRES